MPDGGRVSIPVASSVFTIANAVSFARLCAVPLAIWLVLHQRLAEAFWLFVAAGASDALDGWMARRWGGSTLGAVLDPLADKALMIGMYITLSWVGVLPDWLTFLVVFRDLVIMGGVLVLMLSGQNVRIRPLAISKFNTLLQIVLVAASLCLMGYGVDIPLFLPTLIWAVSLTTLASGAAYIHAVARGE